ncbi:MAG: alpha/beta hydrolase [Sphingomonas sp.]
MKWLAILALTAAPVMAQQATTQQTTQTVPVTLGAAFNAPQSGRIIVFAKKLDAGEKTPEEVDTSPFDPTGTAIAARDTWSLRPGQVATIDGDTDSFPTAWSKLPPGTYALQAVLDRNHDYNYGGRGPGDVVSPVVEARLPGPVPALTLAETLPDTPIEERMKRLPPAEQQAMTAALQAVRPVDFTSPVLTTFWGRPMHIRGWVALPPGYGAKGKTFPTVYSTGGFGSTLAYAKLSAARMTRAMADGSMPAMIWVYLDESSPRGTHEFADSVNNGPWGAALTSEFIPWIERQYAMDARPGSRFLTGHSSGGWATLWLQVRYPKVFGGSWPTSPDPSDFHDFTNIDIYAPHANAYREPDGTATPLVRDHGKQIATFEQFAKIERVLGPVGGQLASFNWVFSPKGPDGRPEPMFDFATGDVDPAVATYWRDHYDIAYRIRHDWPALKPDLDGKIHLYVGTADTFYLNGAARLLKQAFDSVGAHEDITFVPDKTHFDLFARGGDPQALMKDIAWSMYQHARPGAKRPDAK